MQEIEGNPRSLGIVISTNVKPKKSKQGKQKMRHIPKGEYPSQYGSKSNHPVYSSSSNRRTSQRKSTTGGESNEGCSGGDDGEDPLHSKIEKDNVIDSLQKWRSSDNYPK